MLRGRGADEAVKKGAFVNTIGERLLRTVGKTIRDKEQPNCPVCLVSEDGCMSRNRVYVRV